jgi:starch synthase
MSEQSTTRAPRTKRAPKSAAVVSESPAPVQQPEPAPEAAAAPAPSKAAGAKKGEAKAAAPAKAAKPAQKKRAAPAPKKAAAPRTAKAKPVKAKAQPTVAPAGASLSVLIVASEAVPFARTGDLADLVGTTVTALGALGHRVTLVMPKYTGVQATGAPIDRFAVSLGGEEVEACCYEVSLGPNARAIFVEQPGFFEREFIYGAGQDDYADNPRRFAFLSRAALEFAAREGEPIDVVQAFDWQTGLVPVFLKRAYRERPALAKAAGVFTIHNVLFQGLCPAGWLWALGLDEDLFSPEALEYWGNLSFLKGGVNFADVVSTVSGEYQTALLTPGSGAGFEGVLAARGAAFKAVLNGDAATVAGDPARVAQALARLYAAAVKP